VGSRLAVGPQQVSRVEVDPESFKPIHSRWKHSVLGDAETSYSAARAEVKMKGKDEVNTIDLEGVFYDNEEVIQLIRRLPLEANYATTLRVFSSLAGGSIVPIKIEVLGQERIEVPAGTFDCWKIKMNLVNQTFWYAMDEHRYLVKFEAGAIIAELTAVQPRQAGGTVRPSDADFEFPLGEAGGGVPSVQEQNSQPPQNQAKLLILAASSLPQLPNAANWCETLNASGTRLPKVQKNTVFALNSKVAGRKLSSLPGDTVVFFETTSRGWNQTGGAELLANKAAGVAVAFADGRALLVDPAEGNKLRWNP